MSDSSRKPLKFNKKYRLISKPDFQSVFDQPTKVSQNFLQLFYRPNQLSHPRLGIIINKSHAPKAVDRNRMRRIIRESFRQQTELQAIDIIVFVRKGWNKEGLTEEVNQLWLKIKK